MVNADKRQPTGDQLQHLREAILAAYDYGSLTRMVRFQLDNQLLRLVPFVDKNLVDMVDALVATYASKPGGLHELATAAIAGNPDNSGLLTVAEELLALDFAPLPTPKTSPAGQITANIGAGASVVAVGTDIIQEVHNYYYAPSKPQAVDPATVKAAGECLAKLPLDHVPPAINALPAGSRMGLGANHLFVGRDKELIALATHMHGAQTVAISQVVAATGMGGIGKTQLAAAFVHRYGTYFTGGVFWLNFGEPAAIAAEISACGGATAMNLHVDFDKLDLPDQVRLVLGAWQSPLPRLLVFDNCEDPNLLAAWRPPHGGARILVTSRYGGWSPAYGVQQVPLDVLLRTESIALLHGFRADLGADDPDLEAIAVELGDLPLALHLAGSYLFETRFDASPGDYLADLRDSNVLDHEAFTQETGYLPTGHDLHVGRTFRLGMGQLDETRADDEFARQMLTRAAHFAPGEPIPRKLLFATLNIDRGNAANHCNKAVRRLTALGLIDQETKGRLRLHRLLARFVLDEVNDGTAQANVEQAVCSEAIRLNKAGFPRALLSWQPHLRHITDRASQRADERAANLCAELDFHLGASGDLRGALPYSQRALAIRLQVLGEKHPHTARSLNNLGGLYQAMGDHAAARPCFEQALAIRLQVLGEKHPHTARSLNNLGSLLQAMGDYAAARPYFEQALAIRMEVLGERHPYTAGSLNNLGGLLRVMGENEAARPYLEQALAIRVEVLGKKHPDTAQSLNNLGGLLRVMGENEAARPYLERALVIRMEALGEKHPDTAQSLNNLGSLLQDMGDLASAHPYLEQALAIRVQVLGEKHPHTARSLNNLGSLLQAMGDHAAARSYYEQALTINREVLGEKHPDTAQSLNNLGSLLHNMDDDVTARPYLGQALAISLEVSDEQNLDTARSLSTMGSLLRAVGGQRRPPLR